MRRIICVAILAAVMIGCNDPAKEIAILKLKNENDSLRARLVSYCDSTQIFRERYIQQRKLILLTRAKCRTYAGIVKKNPTQSVFITNWISRSFQWVDETEASHD